MYATKGKGKDIYIRKMSRDGHGSRKLFCKCAKTAQTQRIEGELGRHIHDETLCPSRSSVPNPRRILQ